MKLFRSDIVENLWMAMGTLRANKLRSFLTVVGVIIGVITVMLIASFISGIDSSVRKEVESYGTRSMYISKYNPGIHVGRLSREERMRKPMTYDDAVDLAKLPTVELAVPFLEITNNFFGQKILVSGGGKTSAAVNLEGTLPDFEKAGTQVLAEGRFFSQYENDANENVCVVGSKVADDFFKVSSPVGETIKIGSEEYRVVGRLRVRRQVPFGAPDSFGIQTAEGFLTQFRAITGGIAIAMVVISSVGLMVGGIGVMNIMLVSVTERTREIGVRKAIGARRRDI